MALAARVRPDITVKKKHIQVRLSANFWFSGFVETHRLSSEPNQAFRPKDGARSITRTRVGLEVREQMLVKGAFDVEPHCQWYIY